LRSFDFSHIAGIHEELNPILHLSKIVLPYLLPVFFVRLLFFSKISILSIQASIVLVFTLEFLWSLEAFNVHH